MKKRVLLIGINLEQVSLHLKKQLKFFSLGLHKVRSYAIADPEVEAAYSIEIRDFTIWDDPQGILKVIAERKPDILGFSIYFWNWKKTTEIVAQLRKDLPGTRVVLGGTEVSTEPIQLMREHPYLDILVKGEGEIAFRELLRGLEDDLSREDLGHIKGLVFRRNGEIVETPNDALITELDVIPTSYKAGGILEDVDLSEYAPLLETMRGCPWDCSYCAWTTVKLRYYSLERLRGELDFLIDRGVKIIMITDADFGLNRKTFKGIIRHLQARRADVGLVPFFIVEGMPTDDPEFLELLNAGYVTGLDIGLQTINPAAIKDLKRPFKKERFEKKYFALRDYPGRNFLLTVDLIYGLPGDDFEGFRESCRYAIDELCPETLSIYPLQIFRGSPLFKSMSVHGIELEEDSPTHVACTSTYSREDMRRSAVLARASRTAEAYLNIYGRDYEQILEEAGATRFEAVDTIFKMYEEYPDVSDRLRPLITQHGHETLAMDRRGLLAHALEIEFKESFILFLRRLAARKAVPDRAARWERDFETGMLFARLAAQVQHGMCGGQPAHIARGAS